MELYRIEEKEKTIPDYSFFADKDNDFELIEEQQDIDIQEIEEFCTKPYKTCTATCEYIERKGNEIIKALKQLDRKIKEVVNEEE